MMSLDSVFAIQSWHWNIKSGQGYCLERLTKFTLLRWIRVLYGLFKTKIRQLSDLATIWYICLYTSAT